MVGDYRKILREALAARVQTNPRYSLRAFARDLEISPAHLSLILKGKHGLSEPTGEKIARKLNLCTQEVQRFVTMVQASDSRSRSARLQASSLLSMQESATDDFHALQLDVFHVISDWYHYAILELTLLPSFKTDVKWIARRLDISRYEIEIAIQRMLRLGLLERVKGRLRCTHRRLATPSGIPSEAIRKFTLQVLDRASKAVVTQSIDERDISTLTVAVKASEIAPLTEHIKKFRRSFNALAEKQAKRSPPDEIYTLAIQFFRLTEKEFI